MVSDSSYDRRVKYKQFAKVALSIMAISMCIIADNYVDIRRHLSTNSGSVFYYFFGSIAFGGLFGVYLAPSFSIFPRCVKNGRNSNKLSVFLTKSCQSGLIMAAGYLFLFLLLGIKMPLIMEYEREPIIQEVAAGQAFAFTQYLVAEGNITYFVIAIWFAFLMGCLCNAAAQVVSLFTDSYSLIKITPTVLLVILVYGSKYLGIRDEIRLDRWLLMRNEYGSPMITVFLATGAVLIIIGLCCWLAVFINRRLSVPHGADHVRRIGKGCGWLIMVSFLYLTIHSLLMPIGELALERGELITPYAFPFMLSNASFQMLYMIGIVAIMSAIPTPSRMPGSTVGTSKTMWRALWKIVCSAVASSLLVILLSCAATWRSISFDSNWGNVWMSLAVRNSAGISLSIPISFVQAYSPAQAMLLSLALTNSCAIVLGIICLCGNSIGEGMGSMIALVPCFMDITAYNLAENKLYNFSPLSLAQSVYYHNGIGVNGISLQRTFQSYFFIVGILILMAMLSHELKNRRKA